MVEMVEMSQQQRAGWHELVLDTGGIICQSTTWGAGDRWQPGLHKMIISVIQDKRNSQILEKLFLSQKQVSITKTSFCHKFCWNKKILLWETYYFVEPRWQGDSIVDTLDMVVVEGMEAIFEALA